METIVFYFYDSESVLNVQYVPQTSILQGRKIVSKQDKGAAHGPMRSQKFSYVISGSLSRCPLFLSRLHLDLLHPCLQLWHTFCNSRFIHHYPFRGALLTDMLVHWNHFWKLLLVITSCWCSWLGSNCILSNTLFKILRLFCFIWIKTYSITNYWSTSYHWKRRNFNNNCSQSKRRSRLFHQVLLATQPPVFLFTTPLLLFVSFEVGSSKGSPSCVPFLHVHWCSVWTDFCGRLRILDNSKDVWPIFWDDNYFSLVPGEQMTVTARYNLPDPVNPSQLKLVVELFNNISTTALNLI